MAPLKVWQLQDLSLQAAARIMNTPAENRYPFTGATTLYIMAYNLVAFSTMTFGIMTAK
jgi:hypothetical protein